MRVRPARLEDVTACLDLDHNYETEFVWQMEARELRGGMSVRFTKARLPRPVTVAYPRQPETMVRDWMHRNSFLVAEEGTRLVGYLNMMVQSTPGVAWVADLVVDARQRRKGVGTALLAQAMQWSRDHNLQRLIVETVTKNYPGIAFCQSRGLSFCGYNDRYYTHQDIALFFGRSLP